MQQPDDGVAPDQTAPADFSVRYFEEDDKGRKEFANDEAFDDSLNKFDTTNLREALNELKGNIHSEDEKEAFNAVMGQLGKVFDRMGNTTDGDKMNVEMDQYIKSIDDEIKHASSELPPEILEELDFDIPDVAEEGMGAISRLGSSSPHIPEKPWTVNQRRKVARFNSTIARVHREMGRQPGGLSRKDVSAVYKAYHATRMTLARGWNNVPVDVWDFLWTVFSADESVNVHRLAHVSMLARDMTEAQVPLSPPQQLLTIEAMFVDGWESKALDSWKRCMSTLGQRSAETFHDFWEIGVRMHCKVADMEQAQRAASKILDGGMDARILMPLIRTWCEAGTKDGQKKAWEAYRQMREILGRTMKLKDYDQVIAYFLTSGHTENALYAFVDMMSNGEIDLTVQKYMPSVVANKFFIGKWLKRLIGADDLAGAYSVIEFMRTKGVEASAIHINGLIGAWNRSGGAQDLETAERVAWEMIENRIAFVQSRKNGTHATRPPAKSGTVPLPRATLETFCILAEGYRLRGLHSQIGLLWEASRDAEISPDAFMMNQLLESHIQAGDHKAALSLYQSLVTDKGTTPDPYTFSALWKTLAVSRLYAISSSQMEEEISATRSLFAETVAFRSVFLPDGMDGQLARKILHSFRRLEDPAGLLIALTCLKEVFKFLPPEALVLELIVGTTKLSWDTPVLRRKLMLAKRDMDNELRKWAGEEMAARLEGPRRGEALYEYLQKKYLPTALGEAGADQKKAVIEASKEMGAYELLAPKKSRSQEAALF
ncbi:hypothetical protein K4F52_007335 [Lecanicillium sp. MT-2017a]|nr:hypothetical protein K4F52_007335 [Lecanicillium sp. MT-2017a]